MIGEARFTADGQYRIDNDKDRAAAMLAQLRIFETCPFSSVEEMREQARKLVHDVTQCRWKVAVLWHTAACHQTRTREISVLTKMAPNSHGDAETWARDSAVDAFLEWANEQEIGAIVESTTILERNDR